MRPLCSLFIVALALAPVIGVAQAAKLSVACAIDGPPRALTLVVVGEFGKIRTGIESLALGASSVRAVSSIIK
jgi:hypothetical protein